MNVSLEISDKYSDRDLLKNLSEKYNKIKNKLNKKDTKLNHILEIFDLIISYTSKIFDRIFNRITEIQKNNNKYDKLDKENIKLLNRVKVLENNIIEQNVIIDKLSKKYNGIVLTKDDNFFC